ALMACPYKAYAERVLRLLPLEPLEPVPDPRTGGLVAHAWLERMAALRLHEEVGKVERDVLAARMVEVGREVLDREDAVVRAVWLPERRKLAPALSERWASDGRTVEAVERDVRREAGGVTVRAVVDRVERGENGVTVLDYKTGSVPAWREVKAGIKPQLA